jgi:hypothetical protein
MSETNLQEISNAFNEAMDSFQKEADELWNSLPYDDRLKIFCAVSKRIYEGEIRDKRSYRGVLYSTFGFEPDAYAVAQCAGYMSIHNSIYDGENLFKTIEDFCTSHMDVTNDDLKAQIDEYISKKYL